MSSKAVYVRLTENEVALLHALLENTIDDYGVEVIKSKCGKHSVSITAIIHKLTAPPHWN